MSKFCLKFERLSPVAGIIKYYHAGKWGERDCYYMVMEYVPGKVLSDLVKARPFPMFKSLKTTRTIISIIDQCHRLKLSLGDIHLGNIIMADDGQLKIIDLDFSAVFSRDRVQDDVVSACKLFYELNHRSEDYPSELRSAIPLKENVIREKYQSASDVLQTLDDLMGD
jgi:serine/threonine protein kinase